MKSTRGRIAVVVALLLAMGACGRADDGTTTTTGVVTAFDGDLGGVESFTILTTDGDTLTFLPEDDLAFDGGPLSHLQSHMMNGAPIRVTYDERDGALVAIAVTDAP